MKSMKRIFAVVLAVMMIALMVPFSAGAAVEKKNLTLTCTEKDFTFDVYQLATIDGANGAQEIKATDESVVSALKKSGNDSATAELIKACDAATTGLGTKVDTYDAAEAQKVISVDTGIYYIKAIAKGVATKANSSIAVVTADTEVDLATKVATDDVTVTKDISAVNGTATSTAKDKAVATAGKGDKIEYTLTAKVPNSAANPLSDYVIKDTIEEGLTVDMSSIKVYLNDESTVLAKDTDYTLTGDNSFDVALGKNGDTIMSKFYGQTVKVVFTATVNEKATSGTNSNDNEDSVTYKFANSSEVDHNVPGDKVQVFTFLINITKVDSASKAKLAGAAFDLKSGEKTIAKATSDKDGIVNFGVQLNEGTYTVVETKAPAGYVLNPEPVTITITPTINGSSKGYYTLEALTDGTVGTGIVGKEIGNVKVTVPETGGMGTWMFTVGGALLIVAAGVMFIILKKRSSAK